MITTDTSTTSVRRICHFCGATFFAQRMDAKTCSGACRQRMYRWRRRLPRDEHEALKLIDNISGYLDYPISREFAIEKLLTISKHIDHTLQLHGIEPHKIRIGK